VKNKGAILLFDEADAVFGKRSKVTGSHDRYANIEINCLLERLDELKSIALLASRRRGENN
jgi:ATP-dependent 26S proteasome regulatory subunit